MALGVDGSGSISASAEEPNTDEASVCSVRVDLRERGGARMMMSMPTSAVGRSPRARRSQALTQANHVHFGSISASAEEPAMSRSTP